MAELDVIQGQIVAPTDTDPGEMTDREMLTEILLNQRAQRDVIAGLVNDIMTGPFGAMIQGGKSPFQAMFGR